MPVLTGPACLTSEECPLVPMPIKPASCGTDFIFGGVNDLYFIPCSQTMSETNILSTEWWEALVEAEGGSLLGNIGIGIGSITKKSQKTEKVASCRAEQVISVTWALKYVIKTFDKTSADTTKDQMDAILKRFNQFQLIARMCDGDNTILPIGQFSTSDFNWTVPESSEDLQTVEVELSWIEFGFPRTYNVAGLSAIVPKA